MWERKVFHFKKLIRFHYKFYQYATFIYKNPRCYMN